MHRYLINFRKSVGERKAELSAKAYSHYRNLQPIAYKVYNSTVGRINERSEYNPFKHLKNKYGQSKKR